MTGGRATAIFAVLAGVTATVVAQDPNRQPALRPAVYEHLSRAQHCTEDGDYQCAFDELDTAGRLEGLTGYEQAQLWNFYAFLYANRDDIAGAIAAYEQLLEQEDVPAGLEQQALYSLATLYMQREEPERALAALDRWFALTQAPSAEPFVLQAQALFRIGDYEAGIDRIDRAIALASERGLDVQEGWYQLRFAMHMERGDFETAADTLEMMIRLWRAPC